MTGAWRLTRAERDATTDQSHTEPDFRKVNHFLWSRVDWTGHLWIPALFLAGELLVLMLLGAVKR